MESPIMSYCLHNLINFISDLLDNRLKNSSYISPVFSLSTRQNSSLFLNGHGFSSYTLCHYLEIRKITCELSTLFDNGKK